MKKLIMQAFALIRQHKKAFITLNVIYYGLFAAGLIIAYYNPQVHAWAQTTVKKALNTMWILALPKEFYFTNPNAFLAVIVTFVINFVFGAFASISVSSLIIPFSGLFLNAGRLFSWGLFSPGAIAYPVFILEGQGFILAAFAVYVYYSRLLMPKRYGLSSHKQGFIEGLKLQVPLYTLIAAVLLIAALVEVPTVFLRGGNSAGPSSTQIEMTDGVKDPFAKQVSVTVKAGDDSVKTYATGSMVYYDTAKVAEADTRVAAVFLEDVNYLRKGSNSNARFTERGGKFTVELGVPKTEWNNEKVINAFTQLESRLKVYVPSKEYQIILFDADSAGNKVEQVFKEKE